MVENFLVVSIGVVIGCAGAFLLSTFLMQHYELRRLPLMWFPVGAVILWLLACFIHDARH